LTNRFLAASLGGAVGAPDDTCLPWAHWPTRSRPSSAASLLLTQVNPYVVGLHLLLSMVLIALAV
jgi:hypothetical protein